MKKFGEMVHMMGLPSLSELGIYGMEAQSIAIIISLVNGSPLLLVGAPGVAKTLLIKKLAHVLGLKFHYYDASKALFEDIIGFPNPESLKEGTLRYVHSEMSLWDKEIILVDEISRANPSSQNKWLEIIREKSLMGKPLTRLRYVFAAMNPPEYTGTYPLELSLADRFSFIVDVPEPYEMSEGDLERLIGECRSQQIGGFGDGNGDLVKQREIWRDTISLMRQTIPLVEEKYGGKIRRYVKRYLHYFTYLCQSRFEDRPVSLSGRRLVFLKENLVGLFAYFLLKYEQIRYRRIEKTVEMVVYWSIPHRITEIDLPNHIVVQSHKRAWKEVFSKGNGRKRYHETVYITMSTVKKVVDNLNHMGKFELRKTITRLMEKANRSNSLFDFSYWTMAIINVIKKVQLGKIDIDHSTLEQLKGFLEVSGYEDINLWGEGTDPDRDIAYFFMRLWISKKSMKSSKREVDLTRYIEEALEAIDLWREVK